VKHEYVWHRYKILYALPEATKYLKTLGPRSKCAESLPDSINRGHIHSSMKGTQRGQLIRSTIAFWLFFSHIQCIIIIEMHTIIPLTKHRAPYINTKKYLSACKKDNTFRQNQRVKTLSKLKLSIMNGYLPSSLPDTLELLWTEAESCIENMTEKNHTKLILHILHTTHVWTCECTARFPWRKHNYLYILLAIKYRCVHFARNAMMDKQLFQTTQHTVSC
jgi:hypothetical protein